MSAKLIQVIEVVITRGEGTQQNPYRQVTEYWSTDGVLLADTDCVAERSVSPGLNQRFVDVGKAV